MQKKGVSDLLPPGKPDSNWILTACERKRDRESDLGTSFGSGCLFIYIKALHVKADSQTAMQISILFCFKNSTNLHCN